jgi:hypothetical protein
MNYSVLNQDIPMIGVKPKDIIVFADRVAHIIKELSASPSQSFQRLEAQLKSLWGPLSFVTFDYIVTNGTDETDSELDAVIMRFSYPINVTKSSRLHFDLQALIATSKSNDFP